MPGIGPWETETDAGDRRRWKRWFGTPGERERRRSICRTASKNWSRPDIGNPSREKVGTDRTAGKLLRSRPTANQGC